MSERLGGIHGSTEQQLEIAEWALRNADFRECDNPACNCNGWHQVGGFKARFDEIKDAVEEAGYSTNGKTLLQAVNEALEDAWKYRDLSS